MYMKIFSLEFFREYMVLNNLKNLNRSLGNKHYNMTCIYLKKKFEINIHYTFRPAEEH